jgi:hypothetical protein
MTYIFMTIIGAALIGGRIVPPRSGNVWRRNRKEQRKRGERW